MELAHVIAFNLALLAAIASPGPSLLFLIRTTLTNGRIAGIAAASGLAIMAALWTLAALLGLDGIFRLFPWLYVVLKTFGAAWLTLISRRYLAAKPVLDRITAAVLGSLGIRLLVSR